MTIYQPKGFDPWADSIIPNLTRFSMMAINRKWQREDQSLQIEKEKVQAQRDKEEWDRRFKMQQAAASEEASKESQEKDRTQFNKRATSIQEKGGTPLSTPWHKGSVKDATLGGGGVVKANTMLRDGTVVPVTYKTPVRLNQSSLEPEEQKELGDPKSYIVGDQQKYGWMTQRGFVEAPGVGGPRYKPGETSVSQVVNTGDGAVGAAQKKAAETYGTGIGSRANDRNEKVVQANRQMQTLDEALLAIGNGARTGFGEKSLYTLRNALETLGIDTGNLGPTEMIMKAGGEFALLLRNPQGGFGLTGNTSNKDLDFLKSATFGLQKTERGNLMIIESLKKYNQFLIDTANYQEKLITKNKGVPPLDLDKKVLEYENNYKFFSKNEQAKIDSLTQPVKATFKEKGTGRTVIELQDGRLEYAD